MAGQLNPIILLKGGTVLQHDSEDNVTILRETDLLVEGDKIARIGKSLVAPSGVLVIDCHDAVVSPGFVDTHHHVWQTQLKGRHSDDTLLDYTSKGNWQPFNYSASDVFWGQLGGLLEAIDGGTTCIVDHAHTLYTPSHAAIRTVYCLSVTPRLKQWDNEIVPEPEIIPQWFLPLLESLEGQIRSTNISMGLGFDSYGLQRDEVVQLFNRAREMGVKKITSHWRRNNIAGMQSSVPKLLQEYGLLQSDVILSHACGSTQDELRILKDAGAFVSCTPPTESQMAHGELVGFEDGVNGSLGADCHSNNPASILHAMRVGLAVARSHRNSRILAEGRFPRSVEPTTRHAFNLATIQGARAAGLADKTGSLAVGKAADIIVIRGNNPTMCCAFDHDPVAAVVRHASVRDIDTVMVAGSLLKKDGVLSDVLLKGPGEWDGYEDVRKAFNNQPLNWEAIAHELRRTRREIQERIDRSDEEVAKLKILEIWGAPGAENLLV